MGLVTKRFSTEGMHCPSCSTLIEMEVGELAGVETVRADHVAGLTEVTFDDALTSPAKIVDAIIGAGYQASPTDE
jgi:Cu+-exporting ATPase